MGMDGYSGIREARYALARDRARGITTLTRQRPPIDIEAIIDLAGIPIVERVLREDVRGTIGDVAGRRSIILSRYHRFSQNERRWVLAEELGHVLLDHRLVESAQPGKPSMGLLEERRVIYEREARAFAAELLMPFFEVRKRWFAISQERPVEGELSVESRIERLATEFGVTPAAMRVRLQQTKLIPS
jgi:Zn-dependent peptidase ImmA (M78 family)